MNKQIKFTYDGDEYCLEFTKRSVEAMERSGFDVNGLNNGKYVTTITSLFYGAFMANHKGIKRSLVDEIYEHLGDKESLISALVDMYQEPISGLMEDPKDGKGNVSWTAIG